MNRQVSDTIIVDGKSFRLYSTPFEGYLERGDPRPVFAAFNTAIWRGYVARWEVFDSRLFLTGLFGRGRMLPSHLIAKLPTNPFERAGHGAKCLRLADLFPEQAPLVFAEWVTERLLVPTGPRVDYVGFQSLHATYRTVDVVAGTVTSKRDWDGLEWARERGRVRHERNSPTSEPEEAHEEQGDYSRDQEDEAESEGFGSEHPLDSLGPQTLISLSAQIEELRRPCGQTPGHVSATD
jgi:hypothetical protein